MLASSAVKEFALANKIPVSSPEKLSNSEVVSQIQNLIPDFVVIASYGKLVPEAIFKAAKIAPLNVHPSLLPKYRGASPIQRAILEGDKQTGVSIAEVTKDLDAGDLFAQREIQIEPNENTGELSQRLSLVASRLILEVMEQLTTGKAKKIPQDSSAFTYAKKIEKEEGKIDWNTSNVLIHNQVRAYFPWPGAYTFLGRKRLKVIATEIDGSGLKIKPGAILEIKPSYISVQTKNGFLLLKQVQLEGKKEMSAYDFALGQRLKPGDLFQ